MGGFNWLGFAEKIYLLINKEKKDEDLPSGCFFK